MSWIAERLETTGRLQTPDEFPEDQSTDEPDWFRADAKATDEEAWIGGWEVPPDGNTKSARWFAFQIFKADFEWAFSKSSPKRVIASLEMLATICCIKLFSLNSARINNNSTCCLTGSTDNKGNTFIINKLMTTKFPSLLLLLELSETLRSLKVSLNLRWRNREANVEADQLTNQDYSSFSPNNRIVVNPVDIKWLVLDRLQGPAEQLYLDLQTMKKVKLSTVTGNTKTPAAKRLKWRDPW